MTAVRSRSAWRQRDSNFAQNRFQAEIRLPITDSFVIRPYYLAQSVHPPTGWDGNGVIGLSLAFKFSLLSFSYGGEFIIRQFVLLMIARIPASS